MGEKSNRTGGFWQALPFWVSLLLIPVALLAARQGGWSLFFPPLFAWGLFSLLDALLGHEAANPDPDRPEAGLFWHRLITLIWPALQMALIFGLIGWLPQAVHLSPAEKIGLFFGVGVISGTIGINYSHELMHQSARWERFLADVLLAMVLYSHFRSEHLRVHHPHVGTPADAVTARYNEGFHRFFPRVLRDCRRSAWRAECAMLARRGRSWAHPSNPYWRYWGLQAGFLALALALGGWQGLALFVWQAAIAVWQLELVNYVEHYGLTRRHLGAGRYEPVMPRHSWNAAHRASNWLLINLQRHSDHHVRPDRRFPLLQSHDPQAAPQLPFSYPLMTLAAMVPPVWRRLMNPRVRAWRAQFYPDITDWQPYNKGRHPLPRGAASAAPVRAG